MDAVTASHGPIWHGATVLVIDNETVMRSFVRRTLEAEDFRVGEAEDGESALALIQARDEPFERPGDAEAVPRRRSISRGS